MPNGRSGGFPLDKADLVQWVAGIPPSVKIGLVTSGERPRPATAADLAALLDSCRHDRMAAEEQDYSLYILHVSDEPIVWVMVGSRSPLFPNLRQRHDLWKTEHPD